MSEEATQTGRVGDWLRLGEVMEASIAELTHLEVLRFRLAEMALVVHELFKEQAASRPP